MLDFIAQPHAVNQPKRRGIKLLRGRKFLRHLADDASHRSAVFFRGKQLAILNFNERMQAENFRAEIRRIAHAAARAQIIQIAGDEAHADFADEAVHKRRRLFKRRFRMFAQIARRGQHDRRLPRRNALGIDGDESLAAFARNQRALHGAGRAGRIRQIENRRIRVLAIKPLKHSLKIMRRTAAGARQLTVFLIKIKHLRRGERAVVARFAAEGNMHRHNHNAVLFRLFGRDIAAGFGHQNDSAHLGTPLISISSDTNAASTT